MHAFTDYFIYNSNLHKLIRRLLTSLSQLLVVLIVWEFLRSANQSSNASDSVMIHISRKSVNLFNCFQKYSQGKRLVLENIISRRVSLTPSGTKTSRYVLTTDVLVRIAGSDSVVGYPEGTPVVLFDDEVENVNQVWEMDYLEYNDEDIIKNIITNKLDDRKQSVPAQFASNFDPRLKENVIKQDPESHSKLTLGYDSNDQNAPAQKQEDEKADSRVVDLMLIEDQMLKVLPQDQNQQQEILQLLQKPKDDRLLLQNTITKAVQFDRKNAKVQTNSKEHQKKDAVFRADENHMDTEQSSLTKSTPIAWPEVVLDETSEPLYTEGFLERVQKVKSHLYSHPMFGHQRLKGKVRNYYLLNNPRPCVRRVDIVYLIHSQPYNSEQRQRLRDTILKSDRFPHFNIVHIFLVGKTTIQQYQEDLAMESKLYGDIVQGDFDDRYENNVWKGIMGMRWVLQFCRNANFIFKMNDNVFVDTDKLLSGLIPASKSIIGKRAMFCALNNGGSNNTNNFTIPYCDNFAILMTRHVVCSILAASHQIRVPAVEDDYLYGILPFVIGGVETYNLSNNLGFQKDSVDALQCFREQQDSCPVVAAKSLLGSFSSLWARTETRIRRNDGWSALWNLQNVKSYFS